MADTIKASTDLAIGLDYIDDTTGKERTVYIKLPNPKSDLTESTIRNAMTQFINQQIVFDPNGNPLTASSVGTAYTTWEEKIDIDIDG